MEEPGRHIEQGEPAQPVMCEVTVEEAGGFHCLPAAQIAKIAMAFEGTIELEKDGRRANGKSVMALLALLAVPEKKVTFRITAQGRDAAAVVASIERVLRRQTGTGETSTTQTSASSRTWEGWANRWKSLRSEGGR